MEDIKILIVEDHKLVRVGIKTLFDDTAGFTVAGEAETAEMAVKMAKEVKPNIILLDIGLPDIKGFEVISEIQSAAPEAKIVVLTAYTDTDILKKCIKQGIYAYIIKDINTDILLNVIKSVYNGAMWFDPKIVPYIRTNNENIISDNKISKKLFKSSHSNLTQREFEVLKLIVDGKSNSDIAKELCISEHTAKAHVCNIIQKLVVDDRTQAAVKAIKEGIIG